MINMYDMPLLEIVCITPTNMTFAIIFFNMHKENECSYTYALNCPNSIIEKCLAPCVIVPDREIAFIKAYYTLFTEGRVKRLMRD